MKKHMDQAFIDKVFAFIEKNQWPIATDTPMIVYIENANIDGSPKVGVIDDWDDWGLLINPIKKNLICQHSATVQYGRKAMMEKPHGGAAKIARGYHHEAWYFGFHKGNPAHPCLKQGWPLKFTRDTNADGNIDGDPTFSGIIGANQHSTIGAKIVPAKVGAWSYACLVRRFPKSHMTFLRIIKSWPRFKSKGTRARFSTYIIGADEL